MPGGTPARSRQRWLLHNRRSADLLVDDPERPDTVGQLPGHACSATATRGTRLC